MYKYIKYYIWIIFFLNINISGAIHHYTTEYLATADWYYPGINAYIKESILNTTEYSIDPKYNLFYEAKKRNLICYLRWLNQIFPNSQTYNILAFIYINRLIKYTCEINIFHKYSCRYVFATAFLLAMKWHNDNCIKSTDYAKFASIDETMLTKLELIFLTSIKFNISVSPAEFESFIHKIKRLGIVELNTRQKK